MARNEATIEFRQGQPGISTEIDLAVTRRCRIGPAAPRRFAITLACLAAAGVLAACGGGGGAWTQAGVNEEMAAYDLYECESYAQDISPDQPTRLSDSSAGTSLNAVESQLQVTEALSYMREDDAFGRCMTSKGYSQTVN